jgi:hypothetical protein
MRIYDPRVGRFLSTDPITKSYPQLTPYQFASNTPIQAIDIDGLELYNVYLKTYQDSKGNARFQVERKETVDNIIDAIGIASRGGQTGVSFNYIYKGAEIEILDPTKKDVTSFWRNITPSNFVQVAHKIGEEKVEGLIKAGMVHATIAAFDEYASTRTNIKAPIQQEGATSRPPEEIVNIELKMKRGWTPEQQAEARAKVASVNGLNPTVVETPAERPSNLRGQFKKAGGQVTSSQDVDHILDLQLGGTNDFSNLQGLNSSVNRSFGPQIQNQIKDLKPGTKVNLVIKE